MLFQGHRSGHEQELGVERAGRRNRDREGAEREVRTVEWDDHGLRHGGILSGIGKQLLLPNPGDKIDGGAPRSARGRRLSVHVDSGHRGHGGRDRPPERVEVVATFEERDVPAGRANSATRRASAA